MTMPDVPGSVDIIANIREVQQKVATDPGAVFWFRSAVTDPEKWDYKENTPGNDDRFGNFHFGVIAKALGISEDILLRLAGYAHMGGEGSGSGQGHYLDPPFRLEAAPGPLLFRIIRLPQSAYGDDPRDQAMIRAGFRFFDALPGPVRTNPFGPQSPF